MPALLLVRAAAFGGHEAIAALGNQIFVTVRRGQAWPPTVLDIRVRYEQTIGDLRVAAAKAAGIPTDALQLFWHRRELLPATHDGRTLLEMNMHTGFTLRGYDLSEDPCYSPPVSSTPDGLVEDGPPLDERFPESLVQ